ncbi:hypothetical protein STAS_30895 [Striga asiatica]|uniref:KIB1-4 beta-propeller domain-containing protein n=1 Tax=Striga asiatica TaxID=4170 RepID=A0A5A7R7G3_STRAF|nr:hypothetical protein STAS_30895 [Striga asiatica]
MASTAFSSTMTTAQSSALICRKTMKHASTLLRFPSSLLSVRSYNSLLRFTPTPLVRFPFLVQNDDGTLSSSSTSPWLMLPPVFGGNNKLDMFYQFYSLGLDRVLSVPKRSIPSYENDNLEIVGSSRGWLALFNKENYCDLFLSNPLTGRHVKLPSLDSLLAFCCPGHTNPVWTRIGDPSTSFQFDSITYSSRQKLFFCAKGPSGRTDHIEAWDLCDPLSPKMVPLPPVTVDKHNYPVASHSELESKLKHLCGYDAVFLVLPEHTEELFQVRQYVLHRMGPDGSFADDVYYEGNSDSDESPHKTVGFDVHKYDPKTGKKVYMDRTLGGLALFVGPQEGFALSADEYQGLKPNSIYYTDMYYLDRYGGHDIGIFNYENETFSPCYYPCDLKSMMTKIVPNPIWFRPSPCAFI